MVIESACFKVKMGSSLDQNINERFGNSLNRVFILSHSKGRARKVLSSLSTLAMDKVLLTESDQLLQNIDPYTFAIVMIQPLKSIEDKIKSLSSSESLSHIPIHVVTSENITEEKTKRLFELGAHTVVAFPKEKKILAQLIRDISRDDQSFQGSTPAERRMSHAIWARVYGELKSAKGWNLWCHKGIVHLMGSLPSFAAKEKLEKLINSAPGVRMLVDSGISIPQSSEIDGELESKIESLISKTPGLNQETLTFKVKNGEVFITGHITSSSSFRKLNEKMSEIAGVKAIHNDAIISRQNSERDRLLARNIKAGIDRFFIHSNVNVVVTQNVAVLKGYVNQRYKKLMVEELAQQFSSISRVVNKISIASK